MNTDPAVWQLIGLACLVVVASELAWRWWQRTPSPGAQRRRTARATQRAQRQLDRRARSGGARD